jgi:hypothetical protein
MRRRCSQLSALHVLAWVCSIGPTHSPHAQAQPRAPSAAPPAAPSRVQPGVQLDPLSVARALESAPAASSVSPHAGEPGEDELTENVAGLVRSSEETPEQTATRLTEEATWRVLRPWQLTSRLGKARYWFVGHTFDALIFDDGSLEFRDKSGVTLTMTTVMAAGPNGGLPNARDSNGDGSGRTLGSPGIGQGKGGGIGISVPHGGRVFERLVTGQEPPNVEARKFMEQTQPLREHLLGKLKAHDTAREDARIDRELERLWQGNPQADAHERTFALWDACADDETGDQARARIEAFVRELQHTQRKCPFSQAALARLNQQRKSKRPFAPCVPAAPTRR